MYSNSGQFSGRGQPSSAGRGWGVGSNFEVTGSAGRGRGSGFLTGEFNSKFYGELDHTETSQRYSLPDPSTALMAQGREYLRFLNLLKKRIMSSGSGSNDDDLEDVEQCIEVFEDVNAVDRYNKEILEATLALAADLARKRPIPEAFGSAINDQIDASKGGLPSASQIAFWSENSTPRQMSYQNQSHSTSFNTSSSNRTGFGHESSMVPNPAFHGANPVRSRYSSVPTQSVPGTGNNTLSQGRGFAVNQPFSQEPRAQLQSPQPTSTYINPAAFRPEAYPQQNHNQVMYSGHVNPNYRGSGTLPISDPLNANYSMSSQHTNHPSSHRLSQHSNQQFNEHSNQSVSQHPYQQYSDHSNQRPNHHPNDNANQQSYHFLTQHSNPYPDQNPNLHPIQPFRSHTNQPTHNDADVNEISESRMQFKEYSASSSYQNPGRPGPSRTQTGPGSYPPSQTVHSRIKPSPEEVARKAKESFMSRNAGRGRGGHRGGGQHGDGSQRLIPVHPRPASPPGPSNRPPKKALKLNVPLEEQPDVGAARVLASNQIPATPRQIPARRASMKPDTVATELEETRDRVRTALSSKPLPKPNKLKELRKRYSSGN